MGKKFAERFLKILHKIRTERFYIDYSSRALFYKLTKVQREQELIKFLQTNPDWIPTEEEILKAKKEYDTGV
jgi:DNA-binding response OmpR family regulator